MATSVVSSPNRPNAATAAEPDVAVAVTARVIASGILRRGANDYCLRATVALLPTIDVNGTSPTISLRNWPSEVQRLVQDKGVPISVSPVRPVTNERPCPKAADADLLKLAAVRPPGIVYPSFARDVDGRIEKSKALRDVDALWAYLISGGRETSTAAWQGLSDALTQSQRHAPLDAVVRPRLDAPAPPAPAPPAVGTPPTPPPQPVADTPDVIPVQRGDAALLYTFERARTVVDALRRSNAPTSPLGEPPQCRRATRDALDIEAIETRFAADRASNLVRVAQLGTGAVSLDAGGAGSTAKTTSQTDIVEHPFSPEEAKEQFTKARKKQDEAIERTLRERREKADRQAEARRAFLAATDPAAARRALEEGRRHRPVGLNPGACAAAANGIGASNVGQLCEGPRNLHLAHSRPEYVGGEPKTYTDAELAQQIKEIQALRNLGTGSAQEKEAADRRIYALQALPSLARLFNLVIDVECPLAGDAGLYKLLGLETKDGSYPDNRGPNTPFVFLDDDVVDGDTDRVSASSASPVEVPGYFLFLTSTFGRGPATASGGAHPQAPLVWTTTKFRPPVARTSDGHFWPCTREEVELRLGGLKKQQMFDLCAVAQVDGLFDLGMSDCDGVGGCERDARHPRFDIITVDPMRAVEADIRNEEMRISRAQYVKDYKARPVTGIPEPEQSSFGTAGLVLVDRWRQSAVVQEAVTGRHQKECLAACACDAGAAPIVLDADELTIGMKLDVGVKPRGTSQRRWRTLMNRSIKFVDPRPHPDANWVEEAIDRLFKNQDDEELPRLDAAFLSVPSRLRANEPDEKNAAKQTIHVEEVVAAWEGDPLGVECREQQQELDAVKNLAITQVIDLFSDIKHREFKPPPLMFGWSYRLGLRPVYLGGVSLPLKRASGRYERAFGGRLALPAPDTEGRRYLRQERIDAPIVAIPEGIAKRGSAMSVETSLVMTLRSSRNRTDDALNSPVATHRVVFAPPVPITFAAQHGVFRRLDANSGFDRQGDRNRPRDGIRRVDYDAAWGGFPIFNAKTGKLRDDKNWQQRHDETLARRRMGFDEQFEDIGGDSVFRPRPAGAGYRKRPYYPDPAAKFMVIAARRPDSADYLPGKPLLVPLYEAPKGAGGAVDDPSRYPNALPVAIEIVKAARRGVMAGGRIQSARQEAVLSLAKSVVSSDGGAALRSPAQLNAVQMRHVQVTLNAGEDYDIDVWCVPAEDELAKWFEVVESVAALTTHEGRAITRDADRACEAGLGALTDMRPNAILKAMRRKSTETDARYWCGPAGLPLPRAAMVRGCAKIIRDKMLLRPISAIAAVTTLRATHALDRPAYAPTLETPDATTADAVDLRIVRYSGADRLKELLETDSRRLHTESSDPGATDVLFTGTLGVDLETSESLDVRAFCVSPLNAAFDDAKRGRSLEDRARDIWPHRTMFPDGSYDLNSEPLKAEKIFGFRVARNGVVTLPSAEVTLLRLDNLPAGRLSERREGAEPLDLLKEQRRAHLRDAADDVARGCVPGSIDPAHRICQVSRPDVFTDPKARRLSVSLLATTRFQGYFVDRARKPLIQESQPEPGASDPRERFFERSGDGPSAQPDQKRRRSHSIWLPATIRPDRISPKSLLPSYVWTSSTVTSKHPQNPSRSEVMKRNPRVRIRIERPWFSSGESERLGIVLWPPDLFEASAVDIRNNKVRRRDRGAVNSNGVMDLSQFTDSDLGPGGPFITRWGADPIRDGDRPSGWFMPASAFADYNQENRKGRAALVRNVRMPIPRGEDDPATPAGAPLPRVDFLNVSLLTYEPRFDADQEHWFVDVEINAAAVPEPFVRFGLVRYQEHAGAELQVSEPIAEWIQIQPTREVEVTANPVANDEGFAVTVTVRGIASSLQAIPAGAPAGRPEDPRTVERHTPTMKMQVVMTERTGAGLETETIVRHKEQLLERTVALAPSTQGTQSAPQAQPAPTAQPTPTPEGKRWQYTFYLPENPATAPGSRSYAIFVEEIERMLPATYPQEPVSGESEHSLLVDSGPRFAAWVDIPKAAG
jgi:hypothetical protein